MRANEGRRAPRPTRAAGSLVGRICVKGDRVAVTGWLYDRQRGRLAAMIDAGHEREVHRSDFFILSVDDGRRILRRSRTERPFTTLPEAETAYEAVLQVADTFHRPSHVVLADVRLAPPRNDPTFEEFVARFTPRLYGGYRRAATLVKTQAGKLQITRLLGDRYGVQVFLEESAALAYLLGH